MLADDWLGLFQALPQITNTCVLLLYQAEDLQPEGMAADFQSLGVPVYQFFRTAGFSITGVLYLIYIENRKIVYVSGFVDRFHHYFERHGAKSGQAKGSVNQRLLEHWNNKHRAEGSEKLA